MKKTLFTFAIYLPLVFLVNLNAFAQYNMQRMTNHLFTTEDGLSSTKITCIHQDDRDFLWVGTEDGLNKFNGYDFTVYKKDFTDSLSLVSNHITALHQDSRGRIWVATIGGLEYYEIELNGFVNVSLNLPEPIVKHNQCTDIAEDSRGNLWFAVSGYGVVCYSPDTEKSMLYSASSKDYSTAICSDYIQSIAEDKKGRMWFASQDNGVSVYDPVDNTFLNLNAANSELTSNAVFDVFCHSNGQMLISTLRGGLVMYDVKEEKFHTYADVFNESHTSSVFCTAEDDKGNILVGTEGKGVFIFDPEKRELTVHPVFVELSDQLGNTKVHCLYRGNFTYVWMALQYKGVFVTGYEKSGFKALKHINNQPNSLSYGSVTGITTDADYTIWVSTDGGGLNSYDLGSQQFTHYKYDPLDKRTLSDNAVVSVFCDSKNRIWAGTYTGGLCLLNRTNGTFRRIRQADRPDGLQSDHIRSILEDEKGYLWLGTHGGGLTRFDPEKETFHTYRSHNNSGLVNDYINILFIDSGKRLWIGTHFGLSCMNMDTESFTLFNQSSGLSNLSISSIAEDANGTIWVGTSNGLNKYVAESNTFTPVYPKSDDYYNSVINGIIPVNNLLWLSTNHGLMRFNPETSELKRYFMNSGLQSNEFILGSYYKSPKGELFFGGTNGLNAFYPEDIYDNDIIPPVYITQLRVFNDPVSINENVNGHVILTKNIEVSQKIKLTRHDKNFTFDFVAMGVFDPYTTTYACKMEGFDKDWVYYDYRYRSVTYTNLSAGEYTFRVKASTNPGVWGDEDTSLTIVIEPAPWNTWWARTIYVLLAILFIYTILHMYIARFREKNELNMERLRIKQQEELTESKTKFFMNITHEFRTPLTLIIGPLERLLYEDDKEKRKNIGQLIMRNVGRLQRLINQILDMNKIEENKMLLHVELIELVSFVSQKISAFAEITRKKDISLTYTCQEEEIHVWYDPDMLDKVLNNLLYNAYKFTNENGKIHVDIKVDQDKQVVLSVKDNGIGMDEETLAHIFDRFIQGRTSRFMGTGIGMNLTKSIIDLHKGSISIESKEGEGSLISFTILPGKDHFTPEELELPADNTKLTEESDEEDGYMEDFVGKIPFELNESADDEESPAQDRPVILLVEDDNDMRYYIKHELESVYRVEEAVNGKSALQIAAKLLPDLIVTDVMMPEMDGIELAHVLKTNPDTSHIPIILLTAQADLKHRLEGLEAGADSYIAKPFSVRYLKIRIKKLIETRLVMKERFSKSINMEAQEVAITSTDEKLLQNAIDYVRSNIENTDLSVESMSKHLGLSRTHLHRKLKALTGQSPVDFIRMIRMKQAAYLLSTGKLSVSEVGYKVGYNTPSYFSSSFNAYFGMSPKAYMDKASEGASEE